MAAAWANAGRESHPPSDTSEGSADTNARGLPNYNTEGVYFDFWHASYNPNMVFFMDYRLM